MSLGDAGKNKDIRQRADDFLKHGVLGCCPELKAALGKTIAEANSPAQPEKKLPNVVNESGKRFDPNAKYKPGMELSLFPNRLSQSALDGQPNFGWVEAPPKRTEEETIDSMVRALKKLAHGPKVVQEVYEVDKNGNPIKKVSGPDDIDEESREDDSDLKGKALGRTLREMNPGNTLIARAAKKFGVWIDDLGKFRCPPGTPQANQFTDDMGSTCFSVSSSQIINAAQEGFASLNRWWGMRQQRRLLTENETSNIDILEGRQEYQRVFTGARARVRKRMAEMEGTVDDLLRMANIKPSPSDNKDLEELLKKLNPNLILEAGQAGEAWDRLSVGERRLLELDGISRENLIDAERGFLMKIVELSITDPERFKRIRVLEMFGGDDNPKGHEAFTSIINVTGNIKDIEFRIQYDPSVMVQTVLTQLKEVKENQRLGLRVRGASTDSEAADLLHKFVVNEDMYAGGMTASLAKNQFIAKGAHTSSHEIVHTFQVDKLVEKIIEKYGENGRMSNLTSGEIMSLMLEVGDGIDLADLGLVSSDLDKIAFLGGQYGASQYKISGLDNELWRLETTAELYALRDMGVIDGDDVDGVLSYIDDLGASNTREMREANKKKNKKEIEKRLTRPLTRPDGRRDTPDAPPPPKPRKPRPIKTAKEASKVGEELKKATELKLDKEELDAVRRVGDPRKHQVMSLADPNQMSVAIMSIDSSHKLAHKHTAELDEIDVTGSSAVERVAYDPKKERLYVTYKGKDDKPSKTYFYRKVSPETVLELHKSKTKGKSINEIRKLHEVSKPIEKIPERIEKTSLDDADIGSQVRHNLIPVLTALDKAEVGSSMRVVIKVNGSEKEGELMTVRGITTARIYYDGIKMNDNEVVLTIPADARGIPVNADIFSRETTGATSLMMMPPMRVSIIGDKDNKSAQLFEQSSANETLNKIIDEWPSGTDAKQAKIMNLAKRRVEEQVAVHLAMGEGDGKLADGSTSPLGARRIRARNADIHDRQTKRRSSPTKPTKQYRDSVSNRGFGSLGRIQTQEERNFDRQSGHANIVSGIRSDTSIDPEIQRIIGNMDDRSISQMLDSVATSFHDGVDRRPRLRVSDSELAKIISDGGRHYKNQGHFSSLEKSYQALIGIHPDTDDLDRPVSGYVVHPAQDLASRSEMRRRGVPVGDAPIEWPTGSNPHGDIDADGDIEIVLKPEVSGRTAYGVGYGIDNRTRPVWLNSDDSAAISDAIIHIDPATDPDGSQKRILNALSAVIDGDFGYLTDSNSVKPAATSQNERTEDFGKRLSAHAKESKPQRLGAQIMGGFVNEEIAEIRYPWSKIVNSSSDVDISDVVNKEPASDRLRRLGFTDQEIEYFYKVNGDRSLDYISSSTMASLKEYRKALQIQQDYKARGIPDVSFMHPAGLDPMDVSSYTANPKATMTIESALTQAINTEVDEILEKMLKQIRKTRGKLWEMKPKAGVSK